MFFLSCTSLILLLLLLVQRVEEAKARAELGSLDSQVLKAEERAGNNEAEVEALQEVSVKLRTLARNTFSNLFIFLLLLLFSLALDSHRTSGTEEGVIPTEKERGKVEGGELMT